MPDLLIVKRKRESCDAAIGKITQTLPMRICARPKFSMIAFAAAVDPLRLANRESGRELFSWFLVSIDGSPVKASNGIEFSVDHDLKTAPEADMVIVCGGADIHAAKSKSLNAWLRRVDRRGAVIGAICTATDILADAGLMEGRRCTIHWENLAALTENYPDLEVTSQLFEIDRNRLTSAGGTAALDLMLHVIAELQSQSLANDVAGKSFMNAFVVRRNGNACRYPPASARGIRSSAPLSA